jgi:hypothetical protein
VSTILAALRLYQQEANEGGADDFYAIASSLGEYQPLDNLEIDDLCERLNLA